MNTSLPLISCICITYNRIALLQKAVGYFCLQNYSNKELVISYPENDRLTRHMAKRLTSHFHDKFILIERSIDISLGQARNEAIQKSTGDYICNWDDDDWYHPNRLSHQLSFILPDSRWKASVLKQIILYDYNARKAYLSFPYPWENTLMCVKSAMPLTPYTPKDKGEDSSIIDRLEADQYLFHIPAAAVLYIYIYHHGNTWRYSHFQSFTARSHLLNSN